jgi:hypothetical protein
VIFLRGFQTVPEIGSNLSLCRVPNILELHILDLLMCVSNQVIEFSLKGASQHHPSSKNLSCCEECMLSLGLICLTRLLYTGTGRQSRSPGKLLVSICVPI